MSGVITAVALVGAAGTAYAANKASSATKDATNTAIAGKNAALSQQSTLSQPYRDIATGTGSSQGAIDQYKALLGLGPQGQAGVQTTLQNTPGYKFTQQQGADATKAQFGAMDLGLSGNTLQGLDKFNTGLADTTYQQVLGNNLNAVQLGQAAAAGQAANIGNAAANTGSLVMNQGNVNAGIDANAAASLAKIGGNVASQYTTMNTLKNLNSQPFDTTTGQVPTTPQYPLTYPGVNIDQYQVG